MKIKFPIKEKVKFRINLDCYGTVITKLDKKGNKCHLNRPSKKFKDCYKDIAEYIIPRRVKK